MFKACKIGQLVKLDGHTIRTIAPTQSDMQMLKYKSSGEYL